MERAGVLTGIDVLQRDCFAALRGSHVGLVTNHTGRNLCGETTIDLMHAAPEVRLGVLFGPEHGIRGEFDEHVADASDQKTGLPVYSLFGTREKPTAEQLAGIDTLVYDIQDIGCRFYTYISTLLRVMEAASEYGLRVVVLDRPNPITGYHLEGPLADADHLSFTAAFPLPVRHGMTTGELARLFQQKNNLGCELEVVPCEGWKRDDWFDATGLLWTNPSPNMRSLTQATLYPGIGLLEMTNLSVGRGTDTPFEIVGAPFIDACTFAWALRQKKLPGLTVVPVQFKPSRSTHAETICDGIQLIITERETVNAVRVGLEIAVLAREMYPVEFSANKFWNLLVNQDTFNLFMAGTAADQIEKQWRDALEEFKSFRAEYLLYR